MLTIERSLRALSQRFARTRGGNRLIEPVRRFYVNKYKNKANAYVTIDYFDGDLRFGLDRASYMGSLIYWRGFHSRNELQCLGRLLQPNMTFVDVGANRGEFTVYAAKRLIDGCVYAI